MRQTNKIDISNININLIYIHLNEIKALTVPRIVTAALWS